MTATSLSLSQNPTVFCGGGNMSVQQISPAMKSNLLCLTVKSKLISSSRSSYLTRVFSVICLSFGKN